MVGLDDVWSTSDMFNGASAFNSPLSLGGLCSTGKWTTAERMFKKASAFNQPVSGLSTRMVTSFAEMFMYASSFNQPIGGVVHLALRAFLPSNSG